MLNTQELCSAKFFESQKSQKPHRFPEGASCCSCLLLLWLEAPGHGIHEFAWIVGKSHRDSIEPIRPTWLMKRSCSKSSSACGISLNFTSSKNMHQKSFICQIPSIQEYIHIVYMVIHLLTSSWPSKHSGHAAWGSSCLHCRWCYHSDQGGMSLDTFLWRGFQPIVASSYLTSEVSSNNRLVLQSVNLEKSSVQKPLWHFIILIGS